MYQETTEEYEQDMVYVEEVIMSGPSLHHHMNQKLQLGQDPDERWMS